MIHENLRACDLPIAGGFITVQSCDDKRANVGVFVRNDNGRRDHYTSAYHVLSVPSLERCEWSEIKPYDLRPEEYDQTIRDNQAALLDLIHYLHHAIPARK